MTRNFGAAARDYAKHRAGFPDSFYDRLKVFGIRTQGQRVVDIGTGTGVLGRGFAQRGCQVIGVDPDERLLEQARLLDREASVHVGWIEQNEIHRTFDLAGFVPQPALRPE